MSTKRCLVCYYHNDEAMASTSIHCTLSQAITGVSRYFDADALTAAYNALHDGDVKEWEGAYLTMISHVRITITMH